MEQDVRPFEKFFPGNHLILGDVGTGKTKLVWSLLKDKEYIKEDSINIVLTDSDKRMWDETYPIPVTVKNCYDTDISWATNPSDPGIYYCACDYPPRIITFLECLATWAVQNQGKFERKLRVFIDISSKTWALPEFSEQITRLNYIASSQDEDFPIEIWAVLGSLNKLTNQTKSIFAGNNLILMNPLPSSLIDELKTIVGPQCGSLGDRLANIQERKNLGYYYAPCNCEEFYVHSDE